MNPIPLDHVPALILLIKPALAEIRRAGITFDNVAEKAEELATVISKHAPGVLALLSGININVIRQMPIDQQLEIANQAVKANVDSAVAFNKHSPEIMENTEKILRWFSEVFNA